MVDAGAACSDREVAAVHREGDPGHVPGEGGDEAPPEVTRLAELRDEFFLVEAARVVADFMAFRPGHAGASAADPWA